MPDIPLPFVVTLPNAKTVAAVLRRGHEPFVCERCGGRFPAVCACPACDADPQRALLADALRLALAGENDARAAFLRSGENAAYDPFGSDEPGSLFLAYRSAAEVCAVARRTLELYDATVLEEA